VAVLLADDVEQIGRIACVQQPESAGQSERGGVHADHAVGEGVKGAPHHPAGVGRHTLHQRPSPLDHLARGPARECEQQDALGGYALAQQPGHTRAQRRRLPGACPSEHEQGTVRMGGGQTLLVV
jgi:hypothetical protein